MKKFKLYLETSVWNFIFADDAPELRDWTLQFFDMVKRQAYDVYISDLVIFEIGKASGKKKEQLMDAVVSWNFEHLANLRKSEIFYAVSVMNGYHRRVEIITPMEVLYAEGS